MSESQISRTRTQVRIERELKELLHTTESVFCGLKDEKDVSRLTAIIVGPEGTPYAGGIFELEITLPSRYPWFPPKVRFVTPIIHCNINAHGVVLMDVLQDAWMPSFRLETILISVCLLLSNPNSDFGEPDLCCLLRKHPNLYFACCRVGTLLCTL